MAHTGVVLFINNDILEDGHLAAQTADVIISFDDKTDFYNKVLKNRYGATGEINKPINFIELEAELENWCHQQTEDSISPHQVFEWIKENLNK